MRITDEERDRILQKMEELRRTAIEAKLKAIESMQACDDTERLLAALQSELKAIQANT